MVDWSVVQLYFMVYIINLVGSLFTGALLFYHGKNALNGLLAYEANARVKRDYSLGLRGNLQVIFGKRLVAALINPFSRSELTHDGIHWEATDRSD